MKKGKVAEVEMGHEMSPEEKIQAIVNVINNLESNFVNLGALLSDVKKSKLYKLKAYPTFKAFVEEEFNLSSTLANKVVGVYDNVIIELNMDEVTALQIGLDKLSSIRPMVKGSTYDESEDWITKAAALSTSELKEEIKEIRAGQKSKEKTLKEVFVEQYFERLVTFFNCSKKEINFKLALFFQDADLEDVRQNIKEKQQKFEDGVL